MTNTRGSNYIAAINCLAEMIVCSDDENLKGEDPLEFEAGLGNIIVVDNLPVVPKEKFEKLEGVIRKIYSQIGVIKEDGLWMPLDPDTQKTLGYCFIEYNTPLLVVKDSQKLRIILGSGMSNRMWEALKEHPKTCVLSGKLYIYYSDELRNVGVVFNNIYELSGLVANEQYYPADSLSDSQKPNMLLHPHSTKLLALSLNKIGL